MRGDARDSGKPAAASRFVGRERELEELAAGLRDAFAGRGRLFLITGEAGIGKTRLAQEITARGSRRGARSIWGSCWEEGGAPAYWPWMQILRALLREGAADALVRLGAAGSLVAEIVPEAREQLRQLPAAPELDPDRARFALFDAVARFLRNVAAERATVLVLEDLHAADESSLLLLRFLTRELRDIAILLVGSYRAVEARQRPSVGALLAEVAREGRELPLAGLGEAEMRSLIEGITGRPPADALVRAIHRTTDGNPFFADGVVRLLAAEGRLDDPGALAAGAFQVPQRVRESIRRRLGVLSKECHAVLVVGAVVGREFDLALLQAVLEQATDRLLASLEQALAIGVLHQVPRTVGRFRFAHALVRETLYGDLQPVERLVLHRRIAEALEILHRANPEPHLAELAHHFLQASPGGQLEKAVDYLQRAGETAARVFAWEEAALHLRTALDLMERHGSDERTKASLLDRLGNLMFVAGLDYGGGVDYLERALSIYDELGERGSAALTHFRLGRHLSHYYGELMDIPRALAHYRAAESVLASERTSLNLGRLYGGIGTACYWGLRVEEGLSSARRAATIALEVGSQRLWGGAATLEGWFLVHSGEIRAGVERLQEAFEAANRSGHLFAVFDSMWNAGAVFFYLWDPCESLRWWEGILDRLTAARAEFQRRILLQAMTTSYVLRGELSAARACLDESRLENPLNRPMVTMYGGPWDEAESDWTRLEDFHRRTGARTAEFADHEMPARLHAARGDFGRAEASLKRALAIAVEGGSVLFEMWARPALATTYAEMNRPRDAGLHLARVEEILAAGEDWRGLFGRAALARAAVAAVTGRPGEAAAEFERAIDVFRRTVCPWNEAEAFYLWGWWLRRGGEPELALEKLRAASEVYRRIGAGGPWVKRVHDLERLCETSETRVAASVNVFHRDGEYWTLGYEGRSVRVRDAKGIRDIAILIASPGLEIHVADLIGGLGEGAGGGEWGLRSSGDAGSLVALDAKARAEYRSRLASLNEDLAAAEAANDPGRATAIREELDFIAGELASAFGLGGRARRSGHPVERARKAVTMRMRDAIARIERVHPALGRHLRKSIRTGTFCCYSPVFAPAWNL